MLFSFVYGDRGAEVIPCGDESCELYFEVELLAETGDGLVVNAVLTFGPVNGCAGDDDCG